ncbi:hypothetical protein CGRA01v4_14163 [Colletotrichum graminicola]|uniref:Tat pathway signal sequence n=1 Tax=Colletotrichum graminicola (strain M1.001 / M2 / FGSC 10212) TaxID=645133 RepID=E3Q502_COLGM|nr:uncharacterized protein GLRG_00913 [Colletotrichum graminicola M1.001]EFQ25769.1 hypothetical protein GLRG_00913 [Colletotrichum graminicola M1.001]WDK22872.1 hypothetical protein CGRA01v4_14163 [Colletotrichum graminicola]
MALATKDRYCALPSTNHDADWNDAGGKCVCDCHKETQVLITRIIVCIILFCALAVSALGLGLHSYQKYSKPAVPFGADQWGFIPPNVGEPASWRTFYNDSRDPYWIDEDTFEDLNAVRRVARRLKWLQNSTNIRALDGTARYRDLDGKEATLPSYHGPAGTQLYGVRSFHQIHCIMVMVEDYGLRLHGEPSQWTPGHVMHCINTLRQLVQCMADAAPITLITGTERHLGDGQQMWCRNFDDLRRWADTPERGVRYAIVVPPGSPPGTVERYKEIWPYPGVSEPPADLW